MKVKAIIAVKEGMVNQEVSSMLSLLKEYFELFSMQDLPYVKKVNSYKIIESENISSAITIGGDGTLLGLSRYLPEYVEVIGINMGGRGVLAQIEKDNLGGFIESYLSKDYIIEKRMRLKAKISDLETVNVLNEFYIQRANFNQTPVFSINVKDVFNIKEKMDGLIISTPSGSTGYNYSNRGPVVEQDLELMILNPVMPLKVLPAIIVKPCEINFQISSHAYIIADGQLRYEVLPDESITVYKGDYLSLVKLKSSSSQIQKILK
ncbi:MAG: NAD(+)/NADH kinase [Nitrososphaeria archaeon]